MRMMKQHWFVGTLGILFILFFAGSTQAQVDADESPYIFRIKMDDCVHAPHSRRQSGFLVEGQVGIITALHGLVDCQSMQAVSSSGDTILRDMVLYSVDAEHDIAVLWSPDLDLENLAGLRPSTLFHKGDTAGDLSIVGYPFGLERQERRPIEGELALEKFNDLIPLDNAYVGFISRESPSIDSDVLRFSMLLQPGLAGAPILDEVGQLVAVASGGLRVDGATQNWALFWEDIAVQRLDENSEENNARAVYQQLATLDLEATFGFSTAFPQQVADPQQLIYATIRIVDSEDNPVEQAEVTLSHAAGYEIGYTDANGYLALRLDKVFDFSRSILLVEAPAYGAVRYTMINPLDNAAVQTYRLVPAAPTATPTATATATATPIPPVIPTFSAPASVRICRFAYTVTNSSTFAPIERARVVTTVGDRIDTGYTDSVGFYRGELPCADSANATATVRVSKMNYRTSTQTILLQGETKDVLLAPLATPTDTPTATPRATSMPTPTITPTPCDLQINPYDLDTRQRADVACPAQDWIPSRPVEIQQFAGGFMIVFDGPAHSNFQRASEEYKTYLLANDGRAWRVFFDSDDVPQLTSPNPDAWYTCDPQPGLRPAESGVPWRRFGRIWCAHPQIRDALGRALTDEIATTASFQSYYRGRVFQLTGEDAVYVLYLDATDETINDPYLTGTWELSSVASAAPPAPVPTATRMDDALLQPTVEIDCNDTKGQVWFTGTVSRNGKPLDGYYVHFKSAKVAGNDPVATVITGRSEQHRDWAPGYFEQFVDVQAATANPKSLHIWVTNPNGRKVSADAYWETDGGSGKCNKAVIVFDTP
jgi:hypothetical protein